jgi:hypothetical protein
LFRDFLFAATGFVVLWRIRHERSHEARTV